MFPSVACLAAIEPWNRAGYSNLLFATGAKDKGERSGLVRGVLVALLAAAVCLFYRPYLFNLFRAHLVSGAGKPFQLPL